MRRARRVRALPFVSFHLVATRSSRRAGRRFADLDDRRIGTDRAGLLLAGLLGWTAALLRRFEALGYRGAELRKPVFLRTYRNDFTPEALDKICRALCDIRR